MSLDNWLSGHSPVKSRRRPRNDEPSDKAIDPFDIDINDVSDDQSSKPSSKSSKSSKPSKSSGLFSASKPAAVKSSRKQPIELDSDDYSTKQSAKPSTKSSTKPSTKESTSSSKPRSSRRSPVVLDESEPESPVKKKRKSKQDDEDDDFESSSLSSKKSQKTTKSSTPAIKPASRRSSKKVKSESESESEPESPVKSKRKPATKPSKSLKDEDDDDEVEETSKSSSRRTSRRSAPVNLKEESNSDFEDEPLDVKPTLNQTIMQSIKPSTKRPTKPSSRKRSGPVKMTRDVDPATALARVDEWREQYNSNQSNNQPLRLSDLPQLMGVKTEVLMMDNDAVRCQIEKQMLTIYQSIMDSTGFSFDIPVRSSNNQLFVPEINRIVLKDKVTNRSFLSYKHTRKCAISLRILQCIYELCIKKIHVTKRDLFYTDVKLFTAQTETDDVLDDVAAMLACTRTSLNVVASEKGIVVGQISFRDDGDLIDCTKMGVGGKAIPPYIDRITEIKGKARFILLVEKDAAFMRLAEDRFYNTYPCVIITGKGQPDVATRLFLKKVKETLKIPILGLVDSDPYGLKILSVYLSGSKNMSYDSASLTTPDVQWLGVRPSDLDRYNIPAQCRLPMTDTDIATGKQMLQEEFIQKNPDWHRELQWMVEHKEKAEIQALSNFGFQFLTQVYLPNKLREGDWI